MYSTKQTQCSLSWCIEPRIGKESVIHTEEGYRVAQNVKFCRYHRCKNLKIKDNPHGAPLDCPNYWRSCPDHRLAFNKEVKERKKTIERKKNNKNITWTTDDTVCGCIILVIKTSLNNIVYKPHMPSTRCKYHCSWTGSIQKNNFSQCTCKQAGFTYNYDLYYRPTITCPFHGKSIY